MTVFEGKNITPNPYDRDVLGYWNQLINEKITSQKNKSVFSIVRCLKQS